MWLSPTGAVWEKTGYEASYMPLPTVPVAILQGQFSFTPAADLVNIAMPPCVGNGANKGNLLPANFGRLGLEAGRKKCSSKTPTDGSNWAGISH